MKKLAIGEQFFETIRQENYLFVDNTKQLFELTNFNKYIFLSRPRRFGKSLLVSTIAAMFEGKKELFKDCRATE